MQPFDRLTVSFLEIAPWTGRFYALLDPSYAKNHIPIIASVSEHQPTAWSSFFFDFELLVFMFPGTIELLSLSVPSILTHTLSLSLSVGIYYCFKELTDANIFIIMYGMTSIYFAVRPFLVQANHTCVSLSRVLWFV